MKNKMGYILNVRLLIAVLLLVSCSKEHIPQQTSACVEEGNINMDHPMKDSLEAIVSRYIARGIPGVQLVLKNDNGSYAVNGGYADIENKKPFYSCTPSWVFSITKTFTAVLMMKMKEEGRINLDKPITEYLPSEKLSFIGQKDRITVRMLLNHSSGIPDVTSLPAFMTGQLNDPLNQPAPEKLLTMLKGEKLVFEPGTGFLYSNSNYLLLYFILEEISGKTYRSLLEEKILYPLHLNHTWYGLSNSQTFELGFPQYYFDRYANDQIENVSAWNGALAAGSISYGGIASTPADIISFYQYLFAGQLVSQQSLQEMTTWIQGQESTQPDYGLGLEYFQFAPGTAAQFGHEGDGIGNSTMMIYIPENRTYMYINITAGRKLMGPYLFKITDLKNELCRFVAGWR